MFIDIQSSTLKLYFFVVTHIFSVLSVLLVTDSGMISSVLKILLVLFVLISFKRCLSDLKNKHCFYLKSDNQAELSIGNCDYHDFQLSGKSYVSDMLMLLIFSNRETGATHSLAIFPDSIDAGMHSQLRSRLKLFSDQADVLLT